MKIMNQFLEEKTLNHPIEKEKEPEFPSENELNNDHMKLIEQILKEKPLNKKNIKEDNFVSSKKILAQPIHKEETKIVMESKPKKSSSITQETVRSEFDVGGVINELVGRIKETESKIKEIEGTNTNLRENIKHLNKEKADRPKYSFTIKRDKDGKIESVLAAPTNKDGENE